MMIQDLTRSWRRQRGLGWMLVAVAAAALGQALAVWLGWPQWWIGSAIFLLVFCGLAAYRPFWLVEDARMARHLNRTRPDFEESAHLLLVTPGQLTPLEMLQRARLVARWELVPPVIPRLNGWLLWTAIFSLTICGLVMRFFSPHSRASAGLLTTSVAPVSTPAGGAALQLTAAKIRVAPPAYLRLAARETHELDLQAEEGALVGWTLRFAQAPEAVFLVLDEKERLPLEARADGSFRAEKRVERSAIYAVEARVNGQTRQLETLFSIQVQPDLPPSVTLLSPTDRTEVDGAAQPTVPVQVRVADDHGITRTALVATVANGSGENVRFRERELPLTRGANGEYLAMLDLPALGLVAGDELYFHAAAADNREPSPQIGRSDTAFLVWPGSASETVPMSHGVTVSVLPVIYRSERQIILDTEKLLAEKAALAAPAFLKRCDKLGVDQHLLRLRYGQFLGEETETAGHHEGPAAASAAFGNAADVVASFGHVHDVQDAASLYDRTTKGGLESALAQMWEAERHLRVGEPELALPFEYEALRILKELDQNARLYVQKSGFEPPPLHEKEDRLTGAGPEKSGEPRRKKMASGDPWEPLRSLAAATSRATRPGPEELAAAQTHLAEKAAADPGKYLPVLQALRQVSARGEGNPAPAQWMALTKELWRVLPPPRARPEAAVAESELTEILRRKDRP